MIVLRNASHTHISHNHSQQIESLLLEWIICLRRLTEGNMTGKDNWINSPSRFSMKPNLSSWLFSFLSSENFSQAIDQRAKVGVRKDHDKCGSLSVGSMLEFYLRHLYFNCNNYTLEFYSCLRMTFPWSLGKIGLLGPMVVSFSETALHDSVLAFSR